MKKQNGGMEDTVKEEVQWPLRIQVNLSAGAETALAKNGVNYGNDSRVVNGKNFVVDIPVYPKDIGMYRALYISDGRAKIHDYFQPYKFDYCINYKQPDAILNDGKECPAEYHKAGTWISVDDRYPLLGEGALSDFNEKIIAKNVDKWITNNGKLPNKDTIRDIVIKTLEQFEDYMVHRKEIFEEYVAKERERMKKEREQEQKKQREKEEQIKREEQKKINALVSKQWIKALKEHFDIDEERNREIARFKKKYGLDDNEIQIYNIPDKPFVHVTAKLDLKPIGINRTLYIRNYILDNWYNMNNTSRSVFSDYSNIIADEIANIFDGFVVVADSQDEDSNCYEAWLLVCSTVTNDSIEIASNEVCDED